ncbi:hypothetical protein MTDSW087_05464 [Methylobacterium dankookense]|nr:hypothetical protein MTDSW087_05464 [Methylobacterium dankookense]
MRAAEAPPRRPEGLVAKPAPDPMAAARVERTEEVAEQADEGLLPDLALPYAAPAVSAVGEAARFVRDRAASVTGTVGGTVRGSVSVLVEAMR